MHGLYRWENDSGEEWAKVKLSGGVTEMTRSQYEDGGLTPDFDALPTQADYEAN